MFDFDAAVNLSHSFTRPVGLYSIVLGPRGSGKSGVAGGTFGENRVLFLYLSKEHHGAESAKGIAKKSGTAKFITEYQIDFDYQKGEHIRDSTVIYDRLLDILRSPSLLEKYDVLVFDGLSSIDPHINEHKEVLKSDQFSKSKTVLRLYDQLGVALKALHYKGMDVVCTCATEVFHDSERGELIERPKLRGIGSANNLIGEFSEVLSLMWYTEETEEGKTQRLVFNFRAITEAKGRKVSGETQKIDFSPRITGIDKFDIPEIASASMVKLKEFKVSKVC